MKSTTKITRDEIINAALSLRGTKFRHQGREAQTGIDCVGFAVKIAELIGYPVKGDFTDYRRAPIEETLRAVLNQNADEIPVEDVKRGDFYLIKLSGGKVRHVALRMSDKTDLEKGIEPQLIHAFNGGVVVEPVRQWAKRLVAGFRIRNVAD